MAKISKEQGDKLVSYLKEKWKGKSCPMCQVGSWLVQDNCYQLIEYNAEAFIIGGQVIPVIPVICNNCSNTLLINAILAGAMPPQKIELPSEPNKDVSNDKDS